MERAIEVCNHPQVLKHQITATEKARMGKGQGNRIWIL
jgi:hypothetical protein